MFVDSGAYFCVASKELLNPVIEFGMAVKTRFIQSLKRSPLDANAYSICSALLTGYDAEVDKPVIDAFSHSGTLHFFRSN